jgi:hypothetical protein
MLIAPLREIVIARGARLSSNCAQSCSGRLRSRCAANAKARISRRIASESRWRGAPNNRRVAIALLRGRKDAFLTDTAASESYQADPRNPMLRARL